VTQRFSSLAELTPEKLSELQLAFRENYCRVVRVQEDAVTLAVPTEPDQMAFWQWCESLMAGELSARKTGQSQRTTHTSFDIESASDEMVESWLEWVAKWTQAVLHSPESSFAWELWRFLGREYSRRGKSKDVERLRVQCGLPRIESEWR